jgi:hypothetical protein
MSCTSKWLEKEVFEFYHSTTIQISSGTLTRMHKNFLRVFLLQKARRRRKMDLLNLILYGSSLSASQLSFISRLFGYNSLKSICIQYCELDYSVLTVFLLMNYKSLEEFTFRENMSHEVVWMNEPIGLQILFPSVQRFKSLKVLDIYEENPLNFGIIDMAHLRDSPLRILKIYCSKINTTSFLQLGEAFKTLEEISVSLIDDENILTFEFPSCPVLSKLSLEDCEFRTTQFTLGHFPNLKYISLRNCIFPSSCQLISQLHLAGFQVFSVLHGTTFDLLNFKVEKYNQAI